MSSAPRTTATRRQVLAGSGAAAAIAFTGAFSELFAGTAAARGHDGYGPLVPDPDGLLDLPKGFRYRVLSREGDPLRSGEGPVPGNHDGMAALPGRNGRVHLVRNHEINGNTLVPSSDIRLGAAEGYDPLAKGGTMTVQVDGRGNAGKAWVSLSGTQMNCSGGVTPWGTWISCEETVNGSDVGPDFTNAPNTGMRKHGYLFEVDPKGVSNARPITAAAALATATCSQQEGGEQSYRGDRRSAMLTTSGSASAGVGVRDHEHESWRTRPSPARGEGIRGLRSW